MTYIRTNDNIYNVIEIDKDFGFLSNSPQLYADIYIDVDKVIKQANNIEELCDEYILYEHNRYCIIGNVEAREMAATNYGIIYAAIWVNGEDNEPILKSVSKAKGILPNGKIDWELL